MLTAANLRKMWPRALQSKIEAVVSISDAVFAEHGIDDPLVVAHLMGNITVENGAGTVVRENGNYSARRIVEIFGSPRSSAAVTPEEAQTLQHNARGLFERVYNLPRSPKLAKDLGNYLPGDGDKFRGGGDLQLTGRANYERVGKLTGFDLVSNPDVLSDPKISFRVAVAEFVALGCVPWAKRDNITKVRRLVNGGTNGLADVAVSVRKWKEVLPGIEAPMLLPRAADAGNAPGLMQSKIMQGAMGTAGSIGVSAAAKVAENANTTTSTISVSDIADKVQQATDTITTVSVAKDSAVAVVQTVKPFLGIASNVWAIVAIVAVVVAGVFIAYTIWERYKKMRDQGV